MTNLHLIPINVQDIVEKLNAATNDNEKNNYLYRLEAIRDYCEMHIHPQRIKYEKAMSDKYTARNKK